MPLTLQLDYPRAGRDIRNLTPVGSPAGGFAPTTNITLVEVQKPRHPIVRNRTRLAGDSRAPAGPTTEPPAPAEPTFLGKPRRPSFTAGKR